MLHERIRETLDQSKVLDQRKLSKIAGATESSLSRFLNGLEDLNFASVLKIVQHLYPEEEKSIMADYVLTLKSRNARFALEYCDINSLEEQFTLLVEKLSTSVNPVDKEWARLYEFVKLFKKDLKDNKSLEGILSQLELFNPKEIEMKVMKQILLGYIYVSSEDYLSLATSTNHLELLVEQIKSKYMRDSVSMRLGLMLNYVLLYQNKIEQSRYYSSLVLQQDYFETVKANAYHHLGHSYLFEDYHLAKEYFDKAIHLFQKYDLVHSLKIALCNLSFLQSCWKIDGEFTLPLNNHSNVSCFIYYLLQKGNKDLAKEYLSKVDVQLISENDKAFYYYYQGLIDQNKSSFYHSVKCFQLSRDLFHIKLPLQELLKLGEDEEVLSVWTT